MKVTVNCATGKNFEIDYFSFGDGDKPFVLIPGLSLLPVTPMAKAVAMQYRAFHSGYKVYLFDRKRSIPNGYTIEQMADDTVNAMRLAGLSKVLLMGCSQGGMMAQVIAAKYPEMVEKLVLCSTAATPDENARAVLGRWIELAQAGDIKAFNRNVFQHVYSKAYYDKYAESFALAEELGTPADIARFIPLAKACLGYDAHTVIKGIQCPVLVVGSNIDNVLGGKSSLELAEALNAKLVMYDNYGHAAYDEAPDLHERLIDFFEN